MIFLISSRLYPAISDFLLSRGLLQRWCHPSNQFCLSTRTTVSPLLSSIKDSTRDDRSQLRLSVSQISSCAEMFGRPTYCSLKPLTVTDGCPSLGCLLSLIPCSTRSDARGSDWSALRATWSRLRANKLALGAVHGRVGLGWQDTINNNGKVWQRPLVVTRDTAQQGINGQQARVQKVHLEENFSELLPIYYWGVIARRYTYFK